MGVRSNTGIFFNATLCNQNLIERNLIIQLVIRITSMQEMIDYQVHCVIRYTYDYIISFFIVPWNSTWPQSCTRKFFSRSEDQPRVPMRTERLLQSHSHSHFNFDQRKQKITICWVDDQFIVITTPSTMNYSAPSHCSYRAMRWPVSGAVTRAQYSRAPSCSQ